MLLSHLSLKARLTLGFGLMLALVAVMAGTGVFFLRADMALSRDIERREDVAQQVARWKGETRVNVERTLALAKSGQSAELDQFLKPQMQATSAQITEIQKRLDAFLTDPKERALAETIAQSRKNYLNARNEGFKRLGAGDAEAAAFINREVLPAAQSYLAALDALVDHEDTQTLAARQRFEANSVFAERLLAGSALAAIVLGVVVSMAVIRAITHPLQEAVQVAERIAQGHLTEPSVSQRDDELGALLRALSDMQAQLREMVQRIQVASDSIGNASAEIAIGNQDLSVRTEQTASRLQETASSLEQLTETVQHSAGSAQEANRLALAAAELAQQGGSVVQRVVGTMSEIETASKRIGDIIGVIDGIAFQTNILALNAAVEAARAGEQGRGFAVVAGEVRSLAQRSAQAAKEIKSLIAASVETVDSGSGLVTQAGRTMEDIVAGVQRVSAVIAEISDASIRQSEGIAQVNAAVGQLDQMTQQNAALVEQSAAAASSLKDQAQALNSTVGVFQVEGHSGLRAV